MTKQVIPIVFSTDENFVPYCGVAISSLIKNVSSHNQYEVFVLFGSLSSLSIHRLERLSIDNVKVVCYCINEHIKGLRTIEYGHLTIASAYRLVIPDVFTQFEKILYLDSDIVVNADVAELYNIDIGSNILGAVHGYFKRGEANYLYDYIKTLGINENNFFNAGVLIINIKEFKNNNVAQKCFSLLAEKQSLYYMDQCVLNIVCEEKVYFLPNRWNHEWLYLFGSNKPSPTLNHEIYKTTINPAIIHYDGVEKPWNYPEQFLADYFWAYARQTIFYEEIMYSSQLRHTKKLLEVLGVDAGVVGKCKNIAIYGAGNAGRRYVSNIFSLKLCKIVIWVDRDFAEKQGYELPIESVEKLYTAEFDHVLIAIENTIVSNEVRDMLILNNIPDEKIIQIGKM